MNRWLVRSTVPMALLIALGLVALIGTMVVPATTVETQYDTTTTTAGAPGSPSIVTVDHQGTAVAIVLLVIALGSFAGAIVLAVLRRRNREV